MIDQQSRSRRRRAGARVSRRGRVRRSRPRVGVWILWTFVVVLVWGVVASLAVATAARDLQRGRAAAEEGRDLVLDRELAQARFALDRAQDHFDAARDRLRGGVVAPLRLIPFVGPNIVAVGDLAEAGGAAAAAGEQMAAAVARLDGGVEALAPRDGALPVDAFAELAAPVRRADALLRRSVRVLGGTRDLVLLDRVAQARDEFGEVVIPASQGTDQVSELLAVLPEVLGAEGPRRYLIVAQNPAELRGTGGFIGAFAVATIDDGRFSFSRVGPTDDLPSYPADQVVPPNPDFARRYNRYGGAAFWKNINITADFPSAARAMEALYEKGTGERVDGVIAADPFALSAMLDVAGPVDISGFGTVTTDDIVDVVTHEAYEGITDADRRKRFLGQLFVDTFQGFLEQGGKGDPLRAAQVLGAAVGEGHLLIHATDPDAQAAFLRAGIAGELRPSGNDYLAVILNAGSASKIDYYMERTESYSVRLHADGTAEALIDLSFENTAPRRGKVRYVIGPNVDGLMPGENRFILSVYGPPGATLEEFGRSLHDEDVRVESELGHSVFTTNVQLPSGESERVVMTRGHERGWTQTADGGSYVLTVQSQVSLNPVPQDIVIELPPDMVATAISPGLGLAPDGRVTFTGTTGPPRTFEVRFAPAGTGKALVPAASGPTEPQQN